MTDKSITVGLGNPGDRYEKTRHNVGFMVLDELARRFGLSWRRGEGEYVLAGGELFGRELLLVKPLTYMNLSGRALLSLSESVAFDPAGLLVVCDDFNLPLGSLRLRRGGGDGGHRGLSSIIGHIGTTEFPRLRIGIGPPPPGIDPTDFVLEPFTEEEREVLEETIPRAVECICTFLETGIEAAMSRYNVRRSTTEND